MISNLNKYLDIFGITIPQLHSLMDAAMRSEGDYADFYFENTTYQNLLLKDSEVSSGGFHTDFGVGVRVLKGDKTGYAYSENTAYEDVLRAARAAGSIASGSEHIAAAAACREKDLRPCTDFYPVVYDWREISLSTFVPWLDKLEKEIRSRDTRVDKVVARISNSMSDVLMFNSLRELTYETRPMGSVAVSVIFTSNGKSVSGNVSRSFRMGGELIDDDLILEIEVDGAGQT